MSHATEFGTNSKSVAKMKLSLNVQNCSYIALTFDDLQYLCTENICSYRELFRLRLKVQ
jgi:hypothetical protein